MNPIDRRVAAPTTLGLLLALAGPAASAEPADELVARAEAKRRRAQEELETGRAQRLEARTRWADRLAEAEARLLAARSTLEDVEARVERAEAAIEDRERLRARTERAERELRRLLGQAGQLDPDRREGDAAALGAAAVEGVRARLRALDHDAHIHVTSGEVQGRDGRAGRAEILRLGRILALARGDRPALTGFVDPEARTPVVLGPRLSPEAQAALQSAEPGTSGTLPLDVDGALTSVAPEAPAPEDEGGLAAGGGFVWPILGVGLLGLLVVLERLWFFGRQRARPERIAAVRVALLEGRADRARAFVDPPRSDLDRVLLAGIATFDAPPATREHALETALLTEEPGLERGASLLGAVAGLAPLLGLLGTVTGMISTFDVISTFGTGNPKLLSGGISIALVTTQLGLVVAVPALLAHAVLGRTVARRQALLERARTELLAIGREPPEAR